MSRSLSTITLSIGAPLALLAYAALDLGEPPKPPQRPVPIVGFADLVVDRPLRVAVDQEFVDGILPANAVTTEATPEHGALIRLSGSARAIMVLGGERTATFSCKVSPRPDTVARVRIVGDVCTVE